MITVVACSSLEVHKPGPSYTLDRVGGGVGGICKTLTSTVCIGFVVCSCPLSFFSVYSAANVGWVEGWEGILSKCVVFPLSPSPLLVSVSAGGASER